MFNISKREIMWGGRKLTLETGKVARQADGAVMVTYGETVVLCTAVAQKTPKEGIDFFPLTVNYIEKYYAAGKIPGGYFKRESRPTEGETLASRLIDRPIRPMFHSSFKNETQVICTVVSHDGESDSEVAALVGASAALTLSGIPFMGPIAGARVGFVDDEYVLNPTPDQLAESDLELMVAGTASSVLMVESEAYELSEDEMLGAVMFGHEQMQPVIEMIIDLAEECAKEPWAIDDSGYPEDIVKKVNKLAEKDMKAAYAIQSKSERSARLDEIRAKVNEALVEGEELDSILVKGIVKKLESDIVRQSLIKSGIRIDGRDTTTVRPIVAEIDTLHRAHGSSLFTRGETQALVALTLGNSRDEQMIDALTGDRTEHFMLHYNFPPFSVGEAGMLRAPGRREIGHGALARRALRAVLPTKEEFPYTLRLVSEITESNGSSSMATVCGSALAMMDGGVPIKAPVAGIAMGLVLEGKDFVVLSDILGDEDHLGDMDFKVAGTDEGVTALQMDIKVQGITKEIMQQALDQAKEGRLHILKEMAKAIKTPREDLKDSAPKITTIVIDKDKIREVIGPGGKVITEICEKTGAKIDIEQDGTIRIAAVDGKSSAEAVKMIEDIVAEPEIGEIYDAVVDDVVDFGAFVKFLGNHSGLVHISELAFERVEKVTDVLNSGDEIKVKVLGMDRGKVRLSYRAVDQETGEPVDMTGYESSPPPRRRDGGGRSKRDGDGGGDRGNSRRRDNNSREAGNDDGFQERPRRRRPF